MTYLGLRDWEWMIRLAAQPEHDPNDDFSDIWENSRSGRNPAAEQWLNDRVQYDRPFGSSSPTAWSARPQTFLPHDTQPFETNRDIDDSHEAFLDAFDRGLGPDSSGQSQYNLGGPGEPEPYEPTGPERLASDESWLLGSSKQFNFPGGRDAIESVHNGMHQRGFDLKNAGTEEDPIPTYVHRDTGASITPVGDGWRMHMPGGAATDHAGPSSAAALHQKTMDDRNASEAAEFNRRHRREPGGRDRVDYRPGRGGGGGTYRRETPSYIPKTKAKALGWRELFSHAINGNQGEGREFERASVRSVHNPYRGDTGRLYGVHSDQWNQDFANDAAGRGKVSQAIYHYATPIAWKYHHVQPDGTYHEGTWRIPATSFGSGGFFSTGRVQGLMSGAFRGTDHEYLRDPLVSHQMHRVLENFGIRRQPDQSYKTVDNFGNEHRIAPSQSGQTAIHTVTSPEGRTFTKRVPVLDAVQSAFQMTQSPGAGGPTDPVRYLRSMKYRDSEPAPSRRREVPLRLQPELPFRSSSVASWSEFLRG